MKSLLLIFLAIFTLNSFADTSMRRRTPQCKKLITTEALLKVNEVAEIVKFTEIRNGIKCEKAKLISCGWALNVAREDFEIKCASEKAISKIKIKVRENKSNGLYLKEIRLTTKYSKLIRKIETDLVH